MRWPVAILLGVALAASAPGCRSCDRVESELRTRDNDLREVREELERCEAYNHALQAELKAIRGEVPPPPGVAEKPAAVYPVCTLVLGRQTGGYDNDDCPGDESLQVVVEPRDPEGHAIKAPGTLLVQALEISKEGNKRQLSTWEVPPEKLRRSWRSGLLSTGYSVILPWKVWPCSEKLRVVAQFRLADGRTFEADKDVTIRLTPAAQRRMPPAEPAEPPPSRDDNLLPPPRLLETPGAGAAAPEAPAPVQPAAQILRPVPFAGGR